VKKPKFVDPIKHDSIRVIDGDTVAVILDKGYGDSKVIHARLYGLDTPENKKTRLGGELEKEAGNRVGLVVSEWFGRHKYTHQLYHSSETKPKYAGRTIGRIFAGWPFLFGDDSSSMSGYLCLNDYLLDKGLARPYLGKKKEPWPEAELEQIIARCKEILV
jgi:endonuclease YncB( thermonuclease family)